jgi:hypothetical protein
MADRRVLLRAWMEMGLGLYRAAASMTGSFLLS